MHQLLSLDGTRVTLNSASVAGLPRGVRLTRLLHCLTWILKSRTRQWQQRHTGNVAATVAVLSPKNLPWRSFKVHISSENVNFRLKKPFQKSASSI